MRRLAGLAALALAVAAPVASEPPEWRPVDAATGQVREVEALEALAQAFPDSGSVRLRLLQPLIAAGEGARVLEVLHWLEERGYVFSPAAREQIPRLVGEKHADAAKALLLPDVDPITASEVVAWVPTQAGLVESVFASPDLLTVTVTSVTRKALWVREDGNWRKVSFPGANDLSGIAQDTKRNIGWVASCDIDESGGDGDLFNGVIGSSPLIAEPLHIAAPAGVTLSDIAVDEAGTVFASDPLGGGIYRAAIGESAFSPLVEPGTFRSPQGLAPSADGARLFVSDYRYGLAMIHLASGEVSRLASDVPAILDGIDGLWLHGEELIAVQNGTSPMRISALALSADGSRITGVRVLERAHPKWTEPLGGSIADGALVYVGTGHWRDYVAGELAEGREAKPTEIRRLPLGSARGR